MNKNIKMIIDCDTGVDDALAISYILSNPNIDLLGVTTTYGNVELDLAAKNTLLLLEMFRRTDVGVYKGADHSVEVESYERRQPSILVHGLNGIGNVDLGEPHTKVRDESAVDFILDSARKYKEDLHLVLVGPLTTFAECIRKDEEALRQIGDITIMGGALTVTGNTTRYAEANIVCDPTSAKQVFSSSLHLNIIPLDATWKTLFRMHDVISWTKINEAGRNLYEIARYYYEKELGGEEIGGAMHDPLAAYASYDPSIITNWFDCNLTVEENGRTIGAFNELNLKEKRHRVALDVNADRFTEDYIDMVSRLIESI